MSEYQGDRIAVVRLGKTDLGTASQDC